MADEPGLIRQPHGGALRPFTTGMGAAARRAPMRSIRKETYALLASGTPEAAQRLLNLMASPDERVSAIACAQVLDRVLGKPGDKPQADEDAGGKMDLTHLTDAERAELDEALDVIMRLTGFPVGRAGEAGQIGTIRRVIVDPKSGDADFQAASPVTTYQLPDNGR